MYGSPEGTGRKHTEESLECFVFVCSAQQDTGASGGQNKHYTNKRFSSQNLFEKTFKCKMFEKRLFFSHSGDLNKYYGWIR